MFAISDSLERRAHSDFGLSISNVAADQPVHRQWRLHISFDIGNGCELVWRFLVLERFFKFLLPFRIGGKGVPAGDLALRIELQQLLGHIANGTLDTGLSCNPRRASQLIELRLGALSR